MNSILPLEYYYSPHHIWVQMDENIATLGFTPYVSSRLGEIIYVDFPEEEKNVYQDQIIFSVESVRDLYDFVSPVSGVIFEINSALLDNPELLNDDPLGEGWIIRIDMEKENELSSLIRAGEYSSLTSKALLKEEM